MGRLPSIRLILASQSPQRRKLLKRLGLPFRVIAPRVHEKSSEKNPARLVALLARRKALSVARRHPRAWVLGADTVVACRGKILLKPRSLAESENILRHLNGRWQSVHTGVALALNGGHTVFSEAVVTKALARRLSEEQLKSMAGKHMDKAGAYAIQDRRDPFISRLVGPRDNVIGLPLAAVRRLLKRAKTAG